MKKFAGFTPQQQAILLQKMGYTGSEQQDELDNFIASNPQAQMALGKYAEMAQRRLNPKGMAEGGLATNYGFMDGVTAWLNQDTNQSDAPAGSQEALDEAQQAFADNQASSAGSTPEEQLAAATNAFEATQVPNAAEATATAVNDPSSVVTPANVENIQQSEDQFIAQNTGQVTNQQQADVSTVDQTQTAQAADRTDAATVDATMAQDDVNAALADVQAATADPSEQATVRGQLELLMQDFEGGETPPWASGAMREAMAVMQSRGLGASSMAGAAVVQAAMESAISIAGQDAQTYAQFELQNLNNEQATSILKAQQRIGAIMSDQAADNAAKQFNAASENQVNQFFADLETTVSRFNAEQINGIRRFNAGEENAIEQFNTQLEAAREQFNAQNDLVIAQANAKWRQDIATADAAAQNAANMDYAQASNQLTTRAMDQIWQKERDLMSFAFAASESLEDRNLQLLLADKSIDANEDSQKKSALGYLAGRLLFG